MPSAQDGLAGGRAHRQGREGAAVCHALASQRVEMRGANRANPGVAHAVVPELIGVDQKQVHYLSQGVLMREMSPCIGGSISGTTSAPPFS